MSAFEKAVNDVKLLENISNENKLKLYGLYKQAKFGDNTKTKPYFWNKIEIAKWNAWNKYKNVEQKQAEELYVELVLKLFD